MLGIPELKHYAAASSNLAAAAEQLAQDALLDVVHLPDAGRQARHQPLVNRRVVAQRLQLQTGVTLYFIGRG